MDVELSDGRCFEIFEQVEIKAPVVMVTAYDNYAVNAFNVNSIDYLLKPISVSDLQRAVERCRKQIKQSTPYDIEALRGALAGIQQPAQSYKQRHLLRYNDKIVMVETSNIAYFYSEEGSTYLMTLTGESYLMDVSLDVVSKDLNPARFFRISRSCIVSSVSIGQVVKKMGNRLKLSLKPASNIDSFVSRAKTADFMEWLEKCSM
jgi:DNA-binding LytR/AlgR family response regulator